MNISFTSTLQKIESSHAFENFKKQHPDADLCAGFFVLNYEGSSQQQLDYCLENGKIFTFILNNEITIKEAEMIEGKKEKLEKLNKEIKIDLERIEEIIKKKMQEKNISSKINKIIAILQKYKDNQIWNLNCMLKNMEILQIHVNSENGEILKFEKRNMFDFIKRVK